MTYRAGLAPGAEAAVGSGSAPFNSQSRTPSQSHRGRKTSFLTLFANFERVKRKGEGRGKCGFQPFFFFLYYEKELEAIAINKQTWHLALLHL